MCTDTLINGATAEECNLICMPKNYNKRDQKKQNKARHNERKKLQVKQKLSTQQRNSRQRNVCESLGFEFVFAFGLQMKSKVQVTTKDRNRGTQVYEQAEIEEDWGRFGRREVVLVNERQQKSQIQVHHHDEEEPPEEISIRGGTEWYLLISILQSWVRGFEWDPLLFRI